MRLNHARGVETRHKNRHSHPKWHRNRPENRAREGTHMASNKTESASVEDRFAVAVSTGFRRTDPATGRTVELFLCPQKGGGGRPDQS